MESEVVEISRASVSCLEAGLIARVPDDEVGRELTDLYTGTTIFLTERLSSPSSTRFACSGKVKAPHCGVVGMDDGAIGVRWLAGWMLICLREWLQCSEGTAVRPRHLRA